jgi:hypothetical protein
VRSKKGGLVARRENLDFFFTPPTVDMGLHRWSWAGAHCSVLYLLRREVQDCLVGKVVPECDVYETEPRYRLFAATMVILAGIDLLSKFAEGDLGKVTDRYRNFLTQYADMTEMDANAVWYLRNAQMHSFGLADIQIVKRRGKPNTARLRWRLGLSETCSIPRFTLRPVQKISKTRFVCVTHLYEVFRVSLENYEMRVRQDNELGKRFTTMFWRYGVLDTR